MIINLTQHPATPEQIAAGVVDAQADLSLLLNFDALPTWAEIENRAQKLADFAKSIGASEAMIGGAPFLMGPLARHLVYAGVSPLFAFSVRESAEKIIDGKTVKTSVFRHLGFVEPETV